MCGKESRIEIALPRCSVIDILSNKYLRDSFSCVEIRRRDARSFRKDIAEVPHEPKVSIAMGIN